MQYSYSGPITIAALAFSFLYSMLQAIRFGLIFSDRECSFPGPEAFRSLISFYCGIIWTLLLSLSVLGLTFSELIVTALRYSLLASLPICFAIAVAEHDWTPFLPAIGFSFTVPFFESVFGEKIFPLVLLALLAVLLSGILIKVFRQVSEIQERVIPYAIQEGVDNLDDGILFATNGGRIILCNRAMVTLYKTLTGKKLRNAEKFWETIQAIESSDLVTKVSQNDTFLFRFDGGNTWTLYREPHSGDGLSFIQYVALNVTESDRMRKNILLTRATLEKIHPDAEETIKCEQLIERHKARNASMHDAILTMCREISIQRLLFHNDSGYIPQAAVQYQKLSDSFRALKEEMQQELQPEEHQSQQSDNMSE